MEMEKCNKCGVGIGGERYCGHCMADICAERSGLNYQISDLRTRIAALEAELVSAQASADFFSGELYAANSAFEKLAAEADRLRRENAEWRRMVADLDKATLPFLEDGGRYWCEDAEDALRVMVAALRGE